MRNDPGRGWGILISMLAVLTAILTAEAMRAAGVGEFLLQSIRWTARLAFPCFLLAWSASSLEHFWSTAFSRWQLRNRRHLGVTFAVLHLVHLSFIIAGAIHSSEETLAGRPVIEAIGGGLAYLFVIAMLVTSFPGPAEALGPRAWKRLHITGGYWIAIIFLVSYGGRALASPAFIPQAAALVIAFALRLARLLPRR